MLASANDLIYFIELANTLNFSRAAERIGISQPSLSVAIKRLEHAIGVELFIRKKNGLILTQAGTRLLAHARELSQLWHNVKAATLASLHEVQGSVLLGCHPSVAIYALPKILPQLIHAYPKLEVQLTHDLSRKILEGVINFSIDVGIVVNPIKHPDLIIKKLYDDKVTFWVANKSTNAAQKIESNDAVIICDPALLQTQALLKRLTKLGLKYRRLITSSNLEVISMLTTAGVGIGILPTSVALCAYAKQLRTVPKLPCYQDEICLVYRLENRNVKAVRSVIDAIRAS